MPLAEAVRGLLDAVGVPAGQIPASVEAQGGLYRSLLSGRRMLVVLDNARDEGQVRPLQSATKSPAVSAIVFRECNGLRTTWVDIDILSIPAGTLTDWCFGYTGRWRFTGNYNVSYFCSGNNKGGFSYSNAGVYRSFLFGPGKLVALPLNSVPITLTITGWSGSDTCSS